MIMYFDYCYQFNLCYLSNFSPRNWLKLASLHCKRRIASVKEYKSTELIHFPQIASECRTFCSHRIWYNAHGIMLI